MAIENTSDRDPLLHLLGMMGGESTRYITDMESRGADQVVASEQLPAEGDWEKAAELGIIKGEPVPGDDLFVNVTLPEGWTRQRTGHDMYTDILDERGVKRISIGYKAAFYDRWARFTVVSIPWEVVSTMRYSDEAISGEEIPLPDFWDKLTDEEKYAAIDAAQVDLTNDQTRAADYADKTNAAYWQDKVETSKAVAKALVAQMILETE